MARWQQQRGRGFAKLAALTTSAGVLALTGAAPGAMGDCTAVVNITSYYARTVMGVGTPDNHVPVPLRSWIRDQSTTPITVRGGVEVEVKVRVDPICNADAGNPSEITALAASIFLTTDTGDTRSYVTDRSWGWRDGSTGLKPSPLWPDNPGGAPPGAQWLTHIRRSPTREVFWTSLVKNLPANV
eukprot:contig_30629_g7491